MEALCSLETVEGLLAGINSAPAGDLIDFGILHPVYQPLRGKAGERPYFRSAEVAQYLAGTAQHSRPAALHEIVHSVVDFRFSSCNMPCVYFLISEGNVAYVGKTESLHARVGDHVRSQKEFDRVFYLPVESKDLFVVESLFIAYYEPKLNCEAAATKEFARKQLEQRGLLKAMVPS